MTNRENLKQLLQNAAITVDFQKVDGTMRKMECTLREDMLPEQVDIDEVVARGKKPENPETLVVWDLIAEGWRSFRVDSVKTINGEPM